MHSTITAAALIGCDQVTIRRWCARLGVSRLGRDWLISPEVLAQLRERINPGAPGNPQFGAAMGRRGAAAKKAKRRAKVVRRRKK